MLRKCDIDYDFGRTHQDEIIEKEKSHYLFRYLYETISNFQYKRYTCIYIYLKKIFN